MEIPYSLFELVKILNQSVQNDDKGLKFADLQRRIQTRNKTQLVSKSNILKLYRALEKLVQAAYPLRNNLAGVRTSMNAVRLFGVPQKVLDDLFHVFFQFKSLTGGEHPLIFTVDATEKVTAHEWRPPARNFPLRHRTVAEDTAVAGGAHTGVEQIPAEAGENPGGGADTGGEQPSAGAGKNPGGGADTGGEQPSAGAGENPGGGADTGGEQPPAGAGKNPGGGADTGGEQPSAGAGKNPGGGADTGGEQPSAGAGENPGGGADTVGEQLPAEDWSFGEQTSEEPEGEGEGNHGAWTEIGTDDEEVGLEPSETDVEEEGRYDQLTDGDGSSGSDDEEDFTPAPVVTGPGRERGSLVRCLGNIIAAAILYANEQQDVVSLSQRSLWGTSRGLTTPGACTE
jgi:hypothetical protein